MPVILAPRLGQEVQECAPHFTVYKELPHLSWGRGRGPGGGGDPRRVYSPFSPAALGPGTLAGCRAVGVHSRQRPYPWQRSCPQPATSSQRQDVVRTPTFPPLVLPPLPTQRQPGKASSQPPSGHGREPPPPTVSAPACPPLAAKPK